LGKAQPQGHEARDRSSSEGDDHAHDVRIVAWRSKSARSHTGVPPPVGSRQHPCPRFKQSIQTKLNYLSEYRRMKVVALVAGLLAGGYFIDSTYFHGRYFRALSAVAYQITMHFGLR
jgi:hypothetical protein